MEAKNKLTNILIFFKKNAFIFIFYLILFGYFFILFHQVTNLYLDFDIDEYVLRADAFFQGDIFLHHYKLTTETFMFTVNPWYYLAYLFYGVSNETKFLGSTYMIFSSLMCATMLIPRKNHPITLIDLLVFLFVAGFPRVETYWMPFGHITIYGISFVVFYFFVKLLKNENKILSTIMVSLFIFMAIMSDKIAFIAILFPIFILLIRQLFPIEKENKARYKQWLYATIVIAASTIVSVIIRILYIKFVALLSSDKLYGEGFAIKNFTETLSFTQTYITSIKYLYGIDFASGNLMCVASIFQVFFICLAFVSIIYQAINFFYNKKRDYESELISISLLAMMVLTYILKMANTVYAARYFCGMPMITALVVIRTRRLIVEQYDIKFSISKKKAIRLAQIGSNILVGLSIIPLALGMVYFENVQTEPIQTYLTAGEEIKSLGLKYGISHIHSGNNITVTNHKEIDVIYMNKINESFCIQNWGIQEDRITFERNFILLIYNDYTVFNKDDLEYTFGYPKQEILHDEYAILIYDYNLLERIQR